MKRNSVEKKIWDRFKNCFWLELILVIVDGEKSLQK
jgi:hypothetical protein